MGPHVQGKMDFDGGQATLGRVVVVDLTVVDEVVVGTGLAVVALPVVVVDGTVFCVVFRVVGFRVVAGMSHLEKPNGLRFVKAVPFEQAPLVV